MDYPFGCVRISGTKYIFLGYLGFTHRFEKAAKVNVKEAFLLKYGNPLCACCSERVRITGTVGGFSPPGVFEQKKKRNLAQCFR